MVPVTFSKCCFKKWHLDILNTNSKKCGQFIKSLFNFFNTTYFIHTKFKV